MSTFFGGKSTLSGVLKMHKVLNSLYPNVKYAVNWWCSLFNKCLFSSVGGWQFGSSETSRRTTDLRNSHKKKFQLSYHQSK